MKCLSLCKMLSFFVFFCSFLSIANGSKTKPTFFVSSQGQLEALTIKVPTKELSIYFQLTRKGYFRHFEIKVGPALLHVKRSGSFSLLRLFGKDAVSIKKDKLGRLQSIGKIKFGFDSLGRLKNIGNQRLAYSVVGTLKSIGQTSFQIQAGYLMSVGSTSFRRNSVGSITKIGEISIRYGSFSKVVQLGKKKLHYNLQSSLVKTVGTDPRYYLQILYQFRRVCRDTLSNSH